MNIGFMLFEEIDGDVFVGMIEEGGLFGVILEVNVKFEKKIKKRIKKELDFKKVVELSEFVEGFILLFE